MVEEIKNYKIETAHNHIILYQQGGRTTLELEQLRLNLWRTEILSFQAAVEVYRTQGNYLMLFVTD